MLLRSTFLLLLVVVASDGAVDHLKEACGKTPHPALCVSVLSAAPESKTAFALGLAQIAIRAAARMAGAAAAASDAEKELADDVNLHEHDGCTPAAKAGLCFFYCGGGFKVAAWMLQNATDDAARLASARFYFQACRTTPYRRWDCARCRVVGRDRGRRLPAVVSRGSDTERFMEVASRLVALAPGGAAPLPPPSDEVYVFLNWIDEEYVHFPDDCREREPAPLKCYKSGINSTDSLN